MEKTHYRKAFDSPYLSAADITEETELTIKCVRLEPDKTKKTKDLFNTAYFSEKQIRDGEPLKPMILNATNSRIMSILADSKFIDDWNNVKVIVYVDDKVRFGRETVEGLRIKKEANKPQKPMLTDERFANALESIKSGQFTIEKLRDKYQLTKDQNARLTEYEQSIN